MLKLNRTYGRRIDLINHIWSNYQHCMTHQISLLLVMPICNVYLGSILAHWGWETRKCIGKLTIIGSDNGLSPGRRQAIIWTSAGILLIGPLGTNFSEILIGIQTFSFSKMHLKIASAKWRPFCLGLNVLTWLNMRCYIQFTNDKCRNGILFELTKTPSCVYELYFHIFILISGWYVTG